MKRRSFLAGLASSGAMVVFAPSSVSGQAAAPSKRSGHPVAIFTKVFQKHSFDQLAELLNEVAADGAEVTLRGGGHIEPAAKDFATQVQRLVQTLAKHDQRVIIAATDINDLNADTERQLKILKDNGITHYRLRYWTYGAKQAPLAQLPKFTEQALRLAEFNQRHGMVGLCQNHAGANICGNLVWDLAMVLQDVDRQHLGVALDLRHLRAEIRGAYAGAIEAVRDKLVSVFVKDTAVEGGNPRQDRLKEVPLGTGLVNRELFRDVLRSVPPGPLSLHVEYFGQQPIAPESARAVTDAYRTDISTLKNWLAG